MTNFTPCTYKLRSSVQSIPIGIKIPRMHRKLFEQSSNMATIYTATTLHLKESQNTLPFKSNTVRHTERMFLKSYCFVRTVCFVRNYGVMKTQYARAARIVPKAQLAASRHIS